MIAATIKSKIGGKPNELRDSPHLVVNDLFNSEGSEAARWSAGMVTPNVHAAVINPAAGDAMKSRGDIMIPASAIDALESAKTDVAEESLINAHAPPKTSPTLAAIAKGAAVTANMATPMPISKPPKIMSSVPGSSRKSPEGASSSIAAMGGMLMLSSFIIDYLINL